MEKTIQDLSAEKRVLDLIDGIISEKDSIDHKLKLASKKISNFRNSIETEMQKYDVTSEAADVVDSIDESINKTTEIVSDFLDRNPENNVIISNADNHVDHREELTTKLQSNNPYNSINDITPYERVISSNIFKGLHSTIVNMFDTRNLNFIEDVSIESFFIKESDPVNYYKNNVTYNSRAIKFNRGNKVNIFSYGLTLKVTNYEKLQDNGGFNYDILSSIEVEETIRIYGYLNIIDNGGDDIEITHTVNNSSSFKNEGSINFKISYNKSEFYLYIDDITPPRNMYLDANSLQFSTGPQEISNTNYLFIRDAFEIMNSIDSSNMNVDDGILKLRSVHGQSEYGLFLDNNFDDGYKDLLSIISGSDLVTNDGKVYIVPRIKVILSLENIGYFLDNEFSTLLMNNEFYSNMDLLKNKKINIKSMSHMKNLINNGITKSNSNIIKPSKDNMRKVIRNINFTTDGYITDNDFDKLIRENDEFISSKSIDDKDVQYVSTTKIYSTVDGNGSRNTNTIPDYVIVEVGNYSNHNNRSVYKSYNYFYSKHMSEESLSIENVKELYDIIYDNLHKNNIDLITSSSYDGSNVINDTVSNMLSIYVDNMDVSYNTTSLGFIGFGGILNMRNKLSKSIIVVETEVLDSQYEFEKISLSHLNVLSDKPFGIAEKDLESDIDLPNQYKVDTIKKYNI